MTYGEMWLQRRLDTLKKIEKGEIALDLSEVDFTKGLPKRMPRDEAKKYYNEKLRKIWQEKNMLRPKPLEEATAEDTDEQLYFVSKKALVEAVRERERIAFEKGYKEGERACKARVLTAQDILDMVS